MKEVDGNQALEEILKIKKAICEQERKIENSQIFGKNLSISILPDINIDDIVAKLTNNLLTEEQAKEINEIFKSQSTYEAEKGDTPDWVGDIIFEYTEGEIDLKTTMQQLLED